MILVADKKNTINLNARYSVLLLESDLFFIKIAALDQFLGVTYGLKRPFRLVGCYFGTYYPPKWCLKL